MNFINIIINKFIQEPPERWMIKWRVVLPAILLLIIGCITLGYTNHEYSFFTSTFVKQLFWILLGIIVFILIQWIRVQFLNEYAYHLYLLLIVLIILTYYMPIIGGAKRWIQLGIISFQPSELGKLLLVFTLARFISDYQGKISDHLMISLGLIIVMIPVYLVYMQPDFGTAIVYAFISLPMLYWGGVKPFYIFSIIAPIISIVSAFNLTVFSAWMVLLILVIYINQPRVLRGAISFLINISFGIISPYIWNNLLYEHQRNRIITLINPMLDPQGSGYQVIQSITAIGSGGLWGKGLGEGTQTQLRFLPVRDTDFIISVIGEELGLIGISIILVLFYTMIYWLVTYAGSVSNRFSSLTLIGFSSILFIHLSVNMGMTVGILPVTGLPAPFMSYGGSFLITCAIVLALSNNIINHRV